MKTRVLVDTNVLVYAYDRSEPSKQARALETLDALATSRRGVLTAQILSEFFVACTRKITVPLRVEEAYERIHNYLRSWEVVDVTGPIVLEAARGVREHHFSYWDSLIWASARLNQIPVILSGNFNAGGVVEGVLFLNPFEEGFEIRTWIQNL